MDFFHVSIATRAFVNGNRDVTQRYVDAIVEAIAREKKDRPFALDVLKTYLKVTDTSALNATYDHYVGTVIPSAPYVRADQFGDVIQTLGRTNEKVRTFDRKLEQQYVDGRDYEGLELYVLKHLMGV